MNLIGLRSSFLQGSPGREGNRTHQCYQTQKCTEGHKWSKTTDKQTTGNKQCALFTTVMDLYME